MKDTEFVVNVLRKGMSDGEMNELAHGLSAQYTEGFAHHEGFDAGDLAIVVMKRDVDVEACSAPDSQAVAETLDRALQQANQTIEYLRNEGAVLRQQLADKMTVEDAKTLANVAYNRAKHLPCEDCTQQDFEMWWIEYRKENGVVNEQPEPAPTDPVFEGIMSELKNIAGATMGWSDFETEAPNIALYGSFWNAIHIRFGYENEGRKVSDGNRREYLESIANNIVQWRKDNTNEEPKPKADPITADEVLPRIKALAMQFFGWAHEWMQGIVSEQDKSIQLFHTLVADEYELELNIEATNKGLQLFDITRMQYLEKVAQSVADALNK